MRRKTVDFIDITQEELNAMKNEMDDGEIRIIYSDNKLECKLLKIKSKVYEVIYTFGESSFTNYFPEMIKARYPN